MICRTANVSGTSYIQGDQEFVEDHRKVGPRVTGYFVHQERSRITVNEPEPTHSDSLTVHLLVRAKNTEALALDLGKKQSGSQNRPSRLYRHGQSGDIEHWLQDSPSLGIASQTNTTEELTSARKGRDNPDEGQINGTHEGQLSVSANCSN